MKRTLCPDALDIVENQAWQFDSLVGLPRCADLPQRGAMDVGITLLNQCKTDYASLRDACDGRFEIGPPKGPTPGGY